MAGGYTPAPGRMKLHAVVLGFSVVSSAGVSLKRGRTDASERSSSLAYFGRKVPQRLAVRSRRASFAAFGHAALHMIAPRHTVVLRLG